MRTILFAIVAALSSGQAHACFVMNDTAFSSYSKEAFSDPEYGHVAFFGQAIAVRHSSEITEKLLHSARMSVDYKVLEVARGEVPDTITVHYTDGCMRAPPPEALTQSGVRVRVVALLEPDGKYYQMPATNYSTWKNNRKARDKQ